MRNRKSFYFSQLFIHFLSDCVLMWNGIHKLPNFTLCSKTFFSNPLYFTTKIYCFTIRIASKSTKKIVTNTTTADLPSERHLSATVENNLESYARYNLPSVDSPVNIETIDYIFYILLTLYFLWWIVRMWENKKAIKFSRCYKQLYIRLITWDQLRICCWEKYGSF